MININLLPWRALREKEKQREFFFLLLVAIGFCIFISLIIHMVFARELSQQLAVNAYLTEQINIVDQQITQVTSIKQKKDDLLRRLEIIQALETSRVLLVTMFNNFANILPNGIYITSIKKEHGIITITGKARSNQQVSELMKNIDASSSFSNPVLTEIQDNTQTPASVLEEVYSQGFELQMNEASLDDTTLPSSRYPTTTQPPLPAQATIDSSASSTPSTNSSKEGIK